MNFYKHHIGDFAAATAHLTFIEDAAFSRLLRIYYRDEKPLPVELKAVQRLAGARSEEEREAVETVLREFFRLADDGWHNKRCDEEIQRANGQAEANRATAIAREQRRRATKQARTEHESCHESFEVREPSQTPDSRLQTPEIKQEQRGVTAAGLACKAMRQAGCQTANPSHPDLLAAIAEGVTAEALADAVREGLESGKGKPFAWAISTARGRHATGAKPLNGNNHGSTQKLSAFDAARAAFDDQLNSGAFDHDAIVVG